MKSDQKSGQKGEFFDQKTAKIDAGKLVVSVSEYRALLGDQESADEQIVARLEYIESLCRGVIRAELANYAKISRR